MKLCKVNLDFDSGHIVLFSIFLLLTYCQKQPIEPPEKILIKVENKSISVDEFIRRAEYTIRPPYCRGDHNLDKKIILNSLIAEKLMAIEATDTNTFIMDDRIQTYLRGLKEQSMRQWLYKREVQDKVVPDTEKLKQIFELANRKYQIAYFGLPDSNSAALVKQELARNPKAFERISNEIVSRDSMLKREVTWSAGENEKVLDSLYYRPLNKNQIVGPIKIDEKQYLFIKVLHTTISPATTELQARERFQDIKDELTRRESVIQYEKYIYQIMKGKKLDLTGDTFYNISNLLEPIYVQSDEKKAEYLKNPFSENSKNEVEKYRDLQSNLKEFYQDPLFKIDNETWTVEKFVDEILAHPLMFRTKNLNKNNFPQQLKFAIADLVRDHYITKEAYKRGYDKINVVRRNVSMWQDNINYQNYRSELLKKTIPDGATELKDLEIIENYLNATVDSLQKKYSDVIDVDVDAFDKIELTRIDMKAYYKNVPFPLVVPSFPLVTTDNKLDYGRRMTTESK